MRKGLFSPVNVPKLVGNCRTGDAAIDPSVLSRLLVEGMAPETCRRTAVTLTEAGYLERRRTPCQSVLVRSTGALERIFARGLRQIRTALAPEPPPVARRTSCLRRTRRRMRTDGACKARGEGPHSP